MTNNIDILGASSAALSMTFELIKNQYPSNETLVRIIKNTEHELQHKYSIEGISHEIRFTQDVVELSSQLFLGVYKSETKRIVHDFFLEKYDIPNEKWINLIHSQSAVASSAKLGIGIQVNPLCTVAPFAEVGDFVSINRNASIGHHTAIDSFCTINPGVHIAGHCTIAENVTIGMGAIVLDNKKVGKNSIIGAGAVVTKDIPENVLAVGTPAKVIKEL